MTIGTVLAGRYVVEEIVGSGGMAVVYRAWDRRKKRIVAVKVLREEYEKDAEFVRRFEREAEAASKVSHENIINMFDVGTENDTRYIIMEYVDGMTLKDMIREMGHLSSDAVVRMGIRILAAVDHAHKNGIVHRDIKPQNILVNKEGKVKVADFGIARLKAEQNTKMSLRSASALGSVHYISPEQASGEIADEKSDLYSVGVVLYEMLTGKVPFDGETTVSVALKHLNEEPASMRTLDPSISKALDEVVLRALKKDPAQRYQSAAEMARDLRKALDKPGGGFVRQRRPLTAEELAEQRDKKARRRRKFRYTLLGVIIAFVLFAGAVLVWSISFIRITDVAGMSEADAYAALSRDFNVFVRREYNGMVAEGLVIAQEPRGNRLVRKGADAVITVSDGASIVEIGNYAGQGSDEAMNALINAGVRDVVVEYVLDAAPVGTVVSQSPEAGEVSRDEQVVLRVSGETVLMPQLSGYTLENASALIRSEGLTLGNVSTAYSADAAADTVIAQSAAPNSPVLVGSMIDIVIAQSQQTLYYPAGVFSVVVPLDNTHVSVTINSPSGGVREAFSGVLDRGTHAIELSSGERGDHTVDVYLDGTLLEEMVLDFE